MEVCKKKLRSKNFVDILTVYCNTLREWRVLWNVAYRVAQNKSQPEANKKAEAYMKIFCFKSPKLLKGFFRVFCKGKKN
ncbi:MAG: hypothetical protein RSC44_04355, partial [Clostridia bacterium]